MGEETPEAESQEETEEIEETEEVEVIEEPAEPEEIIVWDEYREKPAKKPVTKPKVIPAKKKEKTEKTIIKKPKSSNCPKCGKAGSYDSVNEMYVCTSCLVAWRE